MYKREYGLGVLHLWFNHDAGTFFQLALIRSPNFSVSLCFPLFLFFFSFFSIFNELSTSFLFVFIFSFCCSYCLVAQFVSDSLWLHGLQHIRLPCPLTTPELAQTHVHRVGDAIHLILCRPLLFLPSILIAYLIKKDLYPYILKRSYR